MPDLDRRIRAIIKRENLTLGKLAEYADVSTQAVHKWLSTGAISDVKARVLAREIGLDWLWLRHGITRLPLETLHDVALSSTKNVVLICWDTLEVISMGSNVVDQMEYSLSEVIGRSVMDFLPDEGEIDIRRGQKLLHTLGGSVEYSYRVSFQDKHTLRACIIRGKGTTSDLEGFTYAVEELIPVEPNGLENSIKSFRLQKRSPLPLGQEELEELVEKYPEYPWLMDL